MAGFGSFLKNYAKGGFGVTGLVNAVLGKGISNLWKGLTGTALTSAQQQANAFNEQQAQKQMDFQQQMRDTQYQSAVADMKVAGVNPALMYGSGASGNAAPSGAMATSVDAGKPSLDPIGLLGQIANISLLKAQKDNIKADTKQKIAIARKEESERIYTELKSKAQELANDWYPKLSQNILDKDAALIADLYSQVEGRKHVNNNVDMDTALKSTQIYIQGIEAEWIPRLRAAQEKGQLASAAQSFAEAAYKNYFTSYAEEHGGQLPGYNQALGIAAAIEDVLRGFGMNEQTKTVSDIDWSKFLFKPFGMWSELFGK